LQEVIKSIDERTCAFLLDPNSDLWLTTAIEEVYNSERHKSVLLLIGPEGGFSSDETAAMTECGILKVQVARHVLRVETAALAGCAIARIVLAANFS
jgi:16S rRNA (uracil1498-N3)-methyltransferase